MGDAVHSRVLTDLWLCVSNRLRGLAWVRTAALISAGFPGSWPGFLGANLWQFLRHSAAHARVHPSSSAPETDQGVQAVPSACRGEWEVSPGDHRLLCLRGVARVCCVMQSPGGCETEQDWLSSPEKRPGGSLGGPVRESPVVKRVHTCRRTASSTAGLCDACQSAAI